MKGLPADLTAELLKEYHSVVHLFQISFSTAKYWTDADIDIYYSGIKWEAKGISFDSASLSASPKADNIEFQIDNILLGISTIVMASEVRGIPCTIYRIAVDKNMAVIGGASTLFVGFVDSIEIDNKRAKFSVYNHFIRWKMATPRRIHQATCAWTFKGNQCTYAGAETWCDHSWERCVALSNKLNFGGFRWLPALIEKQIWWGRAPKTSK